MRGFPGVSAGRRRGREDEMVGWHHQLDGHESEQASGVGGDGQGSWRAAVHGVAKSQRRLSHRTEFNFGGNQSSK